MKGKGTSAVISLSILLAGCAGSANHEVVAAHGAADDAMTCAQIDMEMVRVQSIIDGVNKDKEDVSGADVMDGVLWFPFNLIAKNSNYKNALEAADGRMARMSELKGDKNCEQQDNTQQLADTTEKLKALNELYKEGALSEEEYKTSKQKLLSELSS